MNERGFIFPLSVIICYALISYVVHQLIVYETEKRFIYEQERLIQLEALLETAIAEWKETFIPPREGGDSVYTFSYEPGTVTIEVIADRDDVVEITAIASLRSGHRRNAGFLYDLKTQTVYNYWEVTRDES